MKILTKTKTKMNFGTKITLFSYLQNVLQGCMVTSGKP